MEFKGIIFFALIGLAAAVPALLDHLEHHHDHHEEEHHDAPAHYEFSYSVHDSHTGDIKSQHESRHGDKVEGEYSLVEPDGHKRTVKYTSDKHTGFNAHVEREGTDHHVVAEAHHAAPVKYEVHAPVAYAHVQPVAVHHVPVKVASHGHATSHSSISIHHYDHHDDHHDDHHNHH